MLEELKKKVCEANMELPQRIQDKHFMRKHGPNAYYGQIEK